MKLPIPLEFAKSIVSVQPIDGNILKDLLEAIGDGSLIISAKPINVESNKSTEASNV